MTCLHVPEIVQLVSDFLESADRNVLRAVNLTAAHTLSLHLARWPQLLRRLIRAPVPRTALPPLADIVVDLDHARRRYGDADAVNACLGFLRGRGVPSSWTGHLTLCGGRGRDWCSTARVVFGWWWHELCVSVCVCVIISHCGVFRCWTASRRRRRRGSPLDRRG